MISALSQAVFAAALRSLPPERHEWAHAMAAEMESAADAGQALRFAAGCLSAAIRLRMRRAPDQFAAARLAVALAVILPLAVFHFGCALSGMKLLMTGQDHYSQLLFAGGIEQQRAAAHYMSAAPLLTVLLLALSLSHVAAAWQLAKWRPALLQGAMIAALLTTLCLAILIAPVTPGWIGLAIQFSGIAAEILALPLFLMWSGRIEGLKPLPIMVFEMVSLETKTCMPFS